VTPRCTPTVYTRRGTGKRARLCRPVSVPDSAAWNALLGAPRQRLWPDGGSMPLVGVTVRRAAAVIAVDGVPFDAGSVTGRAPTPLDKNCSLRNFPVSGSLAHVRGEPLRVGRCVRRETGAMAELTMICMGCGKTIPLIGAVCPHCHRDKRADAQAQTIGKGYAMIGAIVGGVIGGFTGSLGSGGFGTSLILLFLGIVLGGFIGAVAAPKPTTSPPPPEVRVAELSEQVPTLPEPANQVEARLVALNKLKAGGLITDEEFEAKRKVILEAL